MPNAMLMTNMRSYISMILTNTYTVLFNIMFMIYMRSVVQYYVYDLYEKLCG